MKRRERLPPIFLEVRGGERTGENFTPALKKERRAGKGK